MAGRRSVSQGYSAGLYRGLPLIVQPQKHSQGAYFLLGDLAALLPLPTISGLAQRDTDTLPQYLCFWTVVGLATLLLAGSHNSYAGTPLSQSKGHGNIIIVSFLATSFAMLMVAALFGHLHLVTDVWTQATLAFTPAFLGMTRAVITSRLSTIPQPPQPGALVVSYNHCPEDLPSAMQECLNSSAIAGVLYLCSFHEAQSWWQGPELDDFPAFVRLLRTQQIQDVIFVHHPELDSFTGNGHLELLTELLAYPARIWMAFDVTPNLPDIVRRNSSTCKLVPLVTDHLVTSNNVMKRSFDVAASLVLLTLSLPLLLICAALVRLSGPGPVVFRQIRIGAQGHQFTVLKFRTMVHDPERGFAQARRSDPRVTRIGRFLRRTSLDELLQLLNVLHGDMSLVGPRPHAPETQIEGISFENALRLYRLRHRVKPGITGLAQVRGQRGETHALSNLEQRLASDLEYIQSWSLWLDLLILLRTVPAVLSQRNAC